ncbi:MAG: host-nuclease inhibitor Gam family protein [Hyphomicrobiaceae bacterium]|nr:host-nuclease inhibitor Gam family protein [Hyphomicrobiaceae bacterium]
MAKTKTKTKTMASAVPVPQSREAAAEAIRRIGDLARQKLRIEADMNDLIARAKQDGEAQAAPLSAEIEALQTGVQTWCEANRTALTGGDKTKTVDLGTGVVKWRQLPPKVTLFKIEDIVAALKKAGLKRFLRIKVEVDREAMLKEPTVATQVAGVTIGSAGEEFLIEPHEAELTGQPEVTR